MITQAKDLLERCESLQREKLQLESELSRLRATSISQSEVEAMQAAIRFIMSPSVGVFSEVREEVCGKIQTVINRLGQPSNELDMLRDLRDSWYGVRDMMQKQMSHLESEIARLRLTESEREAVRFCVTASLPETEKLGGVAGELCRMHSARLRGLLERHK